VTETAVKQLITTDPDMRRAVADHLERRKVLGRFRALKDAFDQRIKIITQLVSLYSSGYFADSVGRKAQRTDRDRRVEEAQTARTRALQEQEHKPAPRARSTG